MPASHGFTKRQKERQRQERQKEKVAKRQERRLQKGDKGDQAHAGEDPDIAGIVPGPQPPLDDFADEA
jgi:hypothetical protein